MRKPFYLMFLGLFLAGIAQIIAGSLQTYIDETRKFQEENQCKCLDMCTKDKDHEATICQGISNNFQDCQYLGATKLDNPLKDGLNEPMMMLEDMGLNRPSISSYMLIYLPALDTVQNLLSESNDNFNNRTDTCVPHKIPMTLTNVQKKGEIRLVNADIGADTGINNNIIIFNREDFKDYCNTKNINCLDNFENSATYLQQNYEISKIANGRSLPMYYIIPQYAILTLAEILISITALEFAYTQSSISMKTVCNALWCLTQSFGNVLIILLKGMESFSRRDQLFLSASIAFLTSLLFIWISRKFNIMSVDDIKLKLEGDSNNGYKDEVKDCKIINNESNSELVENSKTQLLSPIMCDAPIHGPIIINQSNPEISACTLLTDFDNSYSSIIESKIRVAPNR